MAAVLGTSQVIGKRSLSNFLPDDYIDAPVNKRLCPTSPDSEINEVSDYESDEDIETPITPNIISTPTKPRSPSVGRPKTPRPKKFLCDWEGCAKAFTRPCRLEEHKRSHTNDRALNCPYDLCTKTFTRDGHLRAHIKSCHTNERNFVCDIEGCDKAFTSGQKLKRHKESHENKENHRCRDFPPCNETFRKASTLQKHVDTVHLAIKPHRCEQVDLETGGKCSANFYKAAQLRCHEAEQHGLARYLCSFCQSDESVTVGFGTYHDLQRHIQIAHPPFCTHCGLVCSSTSEVKAHVEIHHKGISLDERKKFACEYPRCGKSFTKKGNLNIHIKASHTAEKRFKCGVTDLNGTAGLDTWDRSNHCDAAYTSKQTLVNHIKKHHLPGCLPKKVLKAQRAKSHSSRITASNASAVLTGIELPEGGKAEYVDCVVPDCMFRFKSRRGVEKHARIAHGMSESEVYEAIMEREALRGGKFWIGGDIEEEPDEDDEFEGETDDFTGLGLDAVHVRGY